MQEPLCLEEEKESSWFCLPRGWDFKPGLPRTRPACLGVGRSWGKRSAVRSQILYPLPRRGLWGRLHLFLTDPCLPSPSKSQTWRTGAEETYKPLSLQRSRNRIEKWFVMGARRQCFKKWMAHKGFANFKNVLIWLCQALVVTNMTFSL